MRKLVVIDGLPYVGDHTCFQNDDPRYSEFQVGFADELNLSVVVVKEDGTSITLENNQYTAEFSDKTEFSPEDWAGTSEWSNSAELARAIRIKIEDPEGTLIPADAKVIISFNAKVDGEAGYGQVAWNSFGYHFGVVGDTAELEAAPLKVGTMMPNIPTLQKLLIDQNSKSIKTSEQETFRFLCYEGGVIHVKENANLAELLQEQNRKATCIELTVQAGESASDKVVLDTQKIYSYSDGAWTATDEEWIWLDNSQYTLVELVDSDSMYEFGSINHNVSADGYSFYYHNDQNTILSARNQLDTWTFEITKVDAGDGQALAGAWFALYSPSQYDQLTDEAYDALKDKPTQKPAMTIEYDGRTWYLAQITQTSKANGADGTLTWDNMIRDMYIFCEVQPPRGYKLDDTVFEAEKTATHAITVSNTGDGYSLPETGGIGVEGFVMGGLLIMVGCLFIWMRLKAQNRRERRSY